ncbi:MAG: hypothetical protein EBT03_09925 [Betaproteobacteria bacterium]|nr:hypothetical protein [Betaproteobacteria bacterium]NCA17598.1 hypothetical protein [Betaproteobacteria bacterium]
MAKTKTPKFTTWQEIRAEEKRLTEEYSARREELARLEMKLSDDKIKKNRLAAKRRNAVPAEAWKLTQKGWKDIHDGVPWMYTVRYADGTGNTYYPPDEAYDAVTGKPVKSRKKLPPYEGYFVEGCLFEEEPSMWLHEHRFYDIVKIDVADLPPIKRF